MTSWKDVKNSLETGGYFAPVPEGAEMYPVVGVSFIDGYPSNLHKLSELHATRQRYVALVRNPDNPYDSNAIEVRYDGAMLGHLSKDVAARIAPRMDSGTVYKASVYQVRISPDNPNNPGLDILLEELYN